MGSILKRAEGYIIGRTFYDWFKSFSRATKADTNYKQNGPAGCLGTIIGYLILGFIALLLLGLFLKAFHAVFQ